MIHLSERDPQSRFTVLTAPRVGDLADLGLNIDADNFRILFSTLGRTVVVATFQVIIRTMSQPTIQDAIDEGNDSGLDVDGDLELEGKLEPRRVHPYNRPHESPPPMAFPSQSLSAVIRGEIRNVFEQSNIFEPIVQMRTELSELQNQHQESLGTANRVVSEMQRVLLACQSMQNQMSGQLNESRQRLELNSAQVQQVHLEQQRAEASRNQLAQQLTTDQERLAQMQSQHERNCANIQQFASQVENQFQQISHPNVNMSSIPNHLDWNSEPQSVGTQYDSRIGDNLGEVYPRPVMINQ